jgi:hypothetical protein
VIDRIGEAGRWRRTATTYFQKAAATIKWLCDHSNENVRAVGQWEAAELLQRMLSEAQLLTPYLGDEAEETEQAAKDLVARIRAHRLAGKLEQTDGRTPEEAAAFRERAAELRGRA